MENTNHTPKDIPVETVTSEAAVKKDYLIGRSIVISSLILAGAWMYKTPSQGAPALLSEVREAIPKSEQKVLPSEGITLPIVWGDLGLKLVSVGAIDADKFRAVYAERGTFTDEYKNLLIGQDNKELKLTRENAGYLLNLFWALGLASKNQILESGEMANPAYGGAGNFASTAGWTIAAGHPMDHYNRHMFFSMTEKQQKLVDKISRGIYRPCCNNSVHFPDCNHGMAMLGLLELMASEGASEEDIWKTALMVNSYWFPDTYLTIAAYMKNRGVEWENVNPQEMLGINYSSASGFAKIAAQVGERKRNQGQGGCGVDRGQSVPVPTPPKVQTGCGV
ncbi:MAG: hypothetical protein A2849_02110 [Candidatus Taylorbacteria bacterium RIFCSPHIGHO2_01_FULL_51_15]|uniref:Uncharacterized protein n=1 Tax=Candidatus Taylorbacteria bacterium RIFCSPHIGHO2_01_FULL_51_15 TaxID=1802304 RepID=A0A1G2MCY5_9BACT|nr:MAG: hypothetical protein A2849_02110 [Candidatus Taylorbacteria bacterium RIFCSPHIGHO2_01_FULL_51_15]